MPKLAANVSMLFTERPFPERFAAARAAGFRAVEYQFPYDFDAAEIAAAARDAGVRVVLHNFPRGDAGRKEMGRACLPGREADFRADVELAVAYAREAGCNSLHCLAGIPDPEEDALAVEAVYVANLRFAAERLRRVGLSLTIEPLSAGTAPGYFLRSSAQAARLLELVRADNAFIQYDTFHMQTMEGNLAATLERLLPRIGHIQVADVPGRNEPGSGEINFPFLLACIDRLGYEGWVGCEYNPSGDTAQGLKWARSYLQA